VANPAILVVGLGTVTVVILIAVVVSDMDVLAHCKVVIMVKHSLDPFGHVNFVGVECCDKFLTEV